MFIVVNANIDDMNTKHRGYSNENIDVVRNVLSPNSDARINVNDERKPFQNSCILLLLLWLSYVKFFFLPQEKK